MGTLYLPRPGKPEISNRSGCWALVLGEEAPCWNKQHRLETQAEESQGCPPPRLDEEQWVGLEGGA